MQIGSSAGRGIVTSRAVTLVIVLLLVLATVPGTASAATRAGGTVVVGPDEVIDENLDVFGGTVTVYGTVEGDVSGFAGTIVIQGTVEGDVSVAAGTVEIAEGATVGENVDVAAGTLRLAGTVEGDVNVGAGETILASTADIRGDLSYGGSLTQESGASVAGTIEQVSGASFGPLTVPSWIPALYAFLLGLVTLSILVAVFPGTADRIRETGVSDPLRSGVVGLLTLVAVPIALVLLAITIVGIPLTIIGTLLFIVVAWVGSLYGRLVVGSWLLGYTESTNRWAAVGVGMIAVAVGIRLPLIGGLVNFLVFLLGLGALALVALRRYRGSRGEQPEADEGSVSTMGEGGRPA